MALDITIQSEALDRLAKVALQRHREMMGVLDRDMQYIASQVMFTAAKETPIKTGTTRRQWLINKPFPLAYDIKNDGKVALFLDEGTKPHVIRPVRKKALAFMVGGDNVVVKSVKHPGTKPRHMRKKAQDVGQKLLVEMVQKRAKEMGVLL